MINSSEHPQLSQDRHPPRNAEQQLCSDALQSTSYDHMSDKEWIDLCEQVADQAREVKPKPEASPQQSGV
jgi:hypothetical protein